MRTRYLFITVACAVVFAGVVALRAVSALRSGPEGGVSPAVSAPAETAVSQVESVVKDGAAEPSVNEPAATQEEQGQDGPALVEKRCSQCHMVQMLEQIEQPRGDWEAWLAKMEGFGVRLEAGERAVLLDYLAVTEVP